MNRTMRLMPIVLVVILVSGVAFAQWQKIGGEQLPDNLGDIRADQLVTGGIRSTGTGGLRLEDGDGALGIFVSEGGFVGIRHSNPVAPLDISGSGLLLAVGQPLGWNLYYSSGWKRKTDGFGSYFLTRSDNGDLTYYTASNGTGGPVTATEKWRIKNDGTHRFGGDPVLEFAFDTAANEFVYGSGAVFRIDADTGNLTGSGDLDLDGSAELGDSSHTLTFYQPVSFFQTGFGLNYDPFTDTIHPTSTGVERYLGVPCPWSVPGTRIRSVEFIVYLATGSDHVNFAVKKQSRSSPGTSTDVSPFAGTDFTQSSLTSLGGGYYSRLETLNTTLSTGEKLWAVVELYAAGAGTDCRIHGAWWTLEERIY